MNPHRPASSRAWATWLWLLTIHFATRVLGQAIQHWMPQPFLPAFDSFQGSALPYWILLPTQFVILGLMANASWQVGHGRLTPRRRTGRMLALGGGIYLLGSLARIVVGLTDPTAAAWFRTWIPAVFHIVLAAFVLSLACYHRLRADKRD